MGSGPYQVYFMWSRMRHRCSKKADKKTRRCYFDRGIKVCDEWQIFETFQKWAIENGYREGLWIDRIDGTKGYSPDNCRFVTPSESAINTRSVRYKHPEIKYRGVATGPHESKSRPYKAEVRCKGVRRYLGRFKTPLEAAHAYDEGAKEMHGEFAVLNFPERFRNKPETVAQLDRAATF